MGNTKDGSAGASGSAAAKADERASAEEALKDKYAEFRLAAAQIKGLQEQLQAVDEKRQELEEAAESISRMKEAQGGAKILVPVTSGIFARATLDKSDEMLVNVGSNVCVSKTAEEAKGILKAKLLELAGYQESVLEELNKLTDQADKLERELGQMLQSGE